ncbi:MAG: 3-(3-hydroxy-phenyl)propionate hydroxylase, partial [Pseudonocardiales bacterium]|nr:3-(3-hydroxy-phenyl)propionate hydroxylase [Pseudonocardiales bacterium]
GARQPGLGETGPVQRDCGVLVVGAGPIGLAVATLLAQHGVATTVVDRQDAPYPHPRAVHLDGESARILQHLGVDEEFAAISRPATGLRLLDARLRPFATFRRAVTAGPHGHPEANLFDQPDLEALLRRNLARHPSVTVLGGIELTGITHDRDGVRATLRDLHTGTRECVRAAAVLGCDGARSTVRDAIGARLRDLHFSERWLVVDVRCRRGLDGWGGVDQVCSPRGAATFMRLTGDRYRFEFRLPPGGGGTTRPGEAADLATLTAPWLGGVPPGEWEVLRRAEYVFAARLADRWRRGRVLLLGDAAHQTPPFVGQGLGAGLRDAHNLAWKLAAVLHGSAGDDLLDTYQAERAPHAEATIRVAIRAGRAMTGGQHVAAALRRPLAAALLRLPGAEARALRGTVVRYPPSRWVDRRTHRRDLPGTLCPQPFVRVDGAVRRLDDVLGPGFALLAAGPVDQDLRERARALGAVTVRLSPSEGGVTDDGTLAAWLARGRATAVLLRPDRVVLAASGRTGQQRAAH